MNPNHRAGVRRRRQHGFSLVELLIATAVTLGVTASLFAMLDPAQGALLVRSESADVEQRTRALEDALVRDLVAAGPLVLPDDTWLATPGVLPLRIGLRQSDPAGTFDPTRLTLVGVADGGAVGRLAGILPATSGTVQLDGASCPTTDASCGFRVGTTLVASDHRTGAWDLFQVTATTGLQLTLRHLTPDSAILYPAGTRVGAVVVRTFLAHEGEGSVPQVVQYDGASGADVPVVNHVVSLRFTYAGEAAPPAVIDAAASRVTYGPAPPAVDARPTSFPAGENCTFMRDAAGEVRARLPALAAGSGLVPLDAVLLTDGPWCPGEESPGRYDADLLRIRQVEVWARVQSAVPSLRGPAGLLFTRGGTARGTRTVPDREVHFRIAPRAMGLNR